MVILTDEQLAVAETRGAAVLQAGPRAQCASYDRATGRLVINLVNGCTFFVPRALIEDLHDADEDALSDIVVDGVGLNLRWPALDVDIFVPALMSGTFGTKAWMARELARVAGRSTSTKKAAAARVNGTKGGRPRKSVVA